MRHDGIIGGQSTRRKSVLSVITGELDGRLFVLLTVVHVIRDIVVAHSTDQSLCRVIALAISRVVISPIIVAVAVNAVLILLLLIVVSLLAEVVVQLLLLVTVHLVALLPHIHLTFTSGSWTRRIRLSLMFASLLLLWVSVMIIVIITIIVAGVMRVVRVIVVLLLRIIGVVKLLLRVVVLVMRVDGRVMLLLMIVLLGLLVLHQLADRQKRGDLGGLMSRLGVVVQHPVEVLASQTH